MADVESKRGNGSEVGSFTVCHIAPQIYQFAVRGPDIQSSPLAVMCDWEISAAFRFSWKGPMFIAQVDDFRIGSCLRRGFGALSSMIHSTIGCHLRKRRAAQLSSLLT